MDENKGYVELDDDELDNVIGGAFLGVDDKALLAKVNEVKNFLTSGNSAYFDSCIAYIKEIVKNNAAVNGIMLMLGLLKDRNDLCDKVYNEVNRTLK